MLGALARYLDQSRPFSGRRATAGASSAAGPGQFSASPSPAAETRESGLAPSQSSIPPSPSCESRRSLLERAAPCSPGPSCRPERPAARFDNSSSSCTCKAAAGAAAGASLGAGRSEDLLPPISAASGDHTASPLAASSLPSLLARTLRTGVSPVASRVRAATTDLSAPT